MSEYLSVEVRCEHRGGHGVEAEPETLLVFSFPRGQIEPVGFIPGGRVLLRGRVIPIGGGGFMRTILETARSGWLPKVVHEYRCSICPTTLRIPDGDLQRKLRAAGHAGHEVVEASLL